MAEILLSHVFSFMALTSRLRTVKNCIVYTQNMSVAMDCCGCLVIDPASWLDLTVEVLQDKTSASLLRIV